MIDPRPRKLLDQVRDAIRLKHYSYRTEQTYVGWIRRYIIFHNKTHPKDMNAPEIEAFLTHLAVDGNVSVSTTWIGGAIALVGTRLHALGYKRLYGVMRS